MTNKKQNLIIQILLNAVFFKSASKTALILASLKRGSGKTENLRKINFKKYKDEK